ncbi:membrane protein insertase YidC [Paenibacillus chitinolyticus]|uniref:YidC/Oxa1 family membrane protein insertase n=1 Tax=Paenibacillus chitinolyticus TaxID=79263 RepID=UPI002DBEFEBD|nr:membrane protein insertase YidC [Paenibacillus chitinolyticus]MEC0248535.1 membrane protein insertase YidC [Paenibacillus chitinolyticus]
MSFLQPFISLLDRILNVLAAFTHDWGLAVLLLALLVRSLLFRVNLLSARQQARQIRMQPAIRQLREQYTNQSGKLGEEMLRLYSRYGIKPGLALAAGLIQMPIFMSLYPYFSLHGAQMTSMLIPWMQSLGVPDPAHALPVLYGIIGWLGMLISLVPDPASSQPALLRVGMPLVIMSVSLTVMWRAPAALVLYWAGSGIVTILERLLFRSSYGQKLLHKGIPVSEPVKD